MYTPSSFSETDPDKLFGLIRRYSFGLLVSQHDGEPFASHLPMLVDRSVGLNGRLIGHMARANPQWQQAEGQTVMAVFSGPHAYISPTWYGAANVVPTWNYAAVHVYGTFKAIHNDAAIMQIVQDYTDLYEATQPQPWQVETGSDFNRKLVKAIAGFHIEISRIEGKWKLNQNHPKERRDKVILALEASEDQDAKRVAAMMRELPD